MCKSTLGKGDTSCASRNLIYTIYARYCRNGIYTVHLAYEGRSAEGCRPVSPTDFATDAIANNVHPTLAARPAESSMTNNRALLISRRGSLLGVGKVNGFYSSY